MKELLTYIARSLVDHPDSVVVTEHAGESETVLELRVAPEDMGKVIGRQGRIAICRFFFRWILYVSCLLKQDFIAFIGD